jgi:hypothetical protein
MVIIFNKEKIKIMGKLMNALQKQLKNPEYKKEAEDCIKIFNWIKDTDKEGRVWSSRWNPLVDVKFLKRYSSNDRIYTLNVTGRTLLKGINK